MSFSTVDEKTALIVIDLQAGIVPLPLAHPVDGVVARIVELLGAFRERGLPVVLVNVAGTPGGRTDAGSAAASSFPEGWTELIPELDRQPSDLLVTKHARSAFSRTGLAEQLRGLGVTQVVVTGIATGSGVESTARSAHEEGFHVSLPVDAMTDRTLETHERSIAHIFPRIAETGTTAQFLNLLKEAHS
ncbi:MAG TPA: isochorismatase family cysteine hydrolase [Actinospica sp.]|jgi:nicotinamidase-related amidase|nr:isochorismatase family cysteine hydrolase [Actinospica sp.]